MKTDVNWARLLSQNRVKALGVPWTKEEETAIKNGVNPDDVRAGKLRDEETEEEFIRKMLSKNKDITILRKKELVALAKSKGIEFDEDVATRGDLILEIQKNII